MASNVIQRLSGVFHAARFSQRANLRSGGMYRHTVNTVPSGRYTGSTRGSHSRFHRLIRPVCHSGFGPAPAQAGEADRAA